MLSSPFISVALTTRDASRAASFYINDLGFTLLEQSEGRWSLRVNPNDPPLIVLHEDRNAFPREHRSAGLYHVALRVPTRGELGRLLARLIRNNVPLHGGADHGVSEALYLSDPDGNGIELYADRPLSQWSYWGDELAMVTEPLDEAGLLLAAEGNHAARIHQNTVIGHMHLRVKSLSEAERFFVNILEMRVTQRNIPGALFLSYDGYHHHIGVNIWESRSGSELKSDSVGLRSYGMSLPREIYDRVLQSARQAGLFLDEDVHAAIIRDHDGMTIQLSVQTQHHQPQFIQRMHHA